MPRHTFHDSARSVPRSELVASSLRVGATERLPSAVVTSGISKDRAAHIVLALVALGCALRLTGLDIHSLWFDEAGTVHCATVDDLVATLRQDRHPPLSFLAFGVWIGWFGQSDATLRLLPALLSCLALITFARSSARLTHDTTARIGAVAMYAIAPFLLWYGQEVRMYAFVELGAGLALLAATAWLDEGASPCRVLGVTLGVGLATGSHYLGALAAVSICAAAVVSPGARQRRALVAAAAAAGVAAWLPWFVGVIPDQLLAPWGGTATRAGLVDLGEMPARLILTELWHLPRAIQLAATAPAALLLAAAAYQVIRVALARATEVERRALAAMLAPLAAAFGAGMAWEIDLLPRYLIAVAPPTIAVVAAGLATLPRRRLRGAAFTIVLGGAALLLAAHRSGNLREDYRSACAELAAAWQPGDAVLMVTGTVTGFSQAGLRHYLRDRPEILASLVEADDARVSIASLIERGSRLHVIHRTAPYAAPLFRRVFAALSLEFASEERLRIRYLRFVAKP